MNILVIGSGGREHAITWKLAQSPGTEKLFAYPANPGILQHALLPKINSLTDIQILDFCKKEKIDLVIIGPEQPLADGLSDKLEMNGINCFGPSKEATMIESSKGFAKDFMNRHGIPTAAYKRFNIEKKAEAFKFIEQGNFPLVIKADGLAAGKGVVIAENIKDAQNTLESMFSGMFADAGKDIVIEEFMQGEEASIFAISDGNDFVVLAASQDHKRVFDDDKGLNTGGMGAYAPASIVNSTILDKIKTTIITPVITGLAEENRKFIGCLYVGLMLNNGDAKVVEFNARFGDPETQAVLSVFDGDLGGLLLSAAKGAINKKAILNSSASHSCCVVLASGGYPGTFQKGFEITGIETAIKLGAMVFHAGTAFKDGKYYTVGGRVLGVTALGNTLQEAISNSYAAVSEIHFENMHYRRDIGFKGLKKLGISL